MNEAAHLNEIDKSVKKRGWLKTAGLILLPALPGLIAILLNASTKQEIKLINQQVTKISNIINIGSPPNTGTTKEDQSSNEFKEDDWDISELIKEKEDDQYTGYYCTAEKFSRGSYARMWYKKKIPVRSTLNLTFILKDKTTGKNDNKLPPRLAYSFGSEKEQKLFIPGSDSRFIEFEDPNNKPPTNNRALDRVIDTSKQILLEIKMDYQMSNYYITIDPKITYFPVGEDKQTNPIPVEGIASDLSIINPDKIGSEQRFGFGVFKPDCFKPISFSIK